MSDTKAKKTRDKSSDVQILKNKLDLIDKLMASVNDEIIRISSAKMTSNPIELDEEFSPLGLMPDTAMLVKQLLSAGYVPIPKPATIEAGDLVTIGKGEPVFTVKESNIQRGKARFALVQSGDDPPQLWPVRNLRKAK